MNLPKQSCPVMRDVSRDPIRARVAGSPNGGGGGYPIPPTSIF
jgi:hypothetical protein